jgi:hypothetical protein
MTDNPNIDQQIELLHTYHLDLWAEIEAQLRVLRAAQEEIAKLRMSRVKGEPLAVALWAAQLLARHVATLKGRVHALSTTVAELDTTVAGLVDVLADAKQ